jgi:uncharacterized protein
MCSGKKAKGGVVVKVIFLFLGFFFVALGLIGALFPVLPTTPFMILALACFARSSQRFYNLLYNHRLFGPLLHRWTQYRVIPPMVKVVAVTAMCISLIYVTVFLNLPLLVMVVMWLLITYGAWFVLSKPSYIPAFNNEDKQ